MAGTKIEVPLSEFAVKCTNCRFEPHRIGDSVDCDKCMAKAMAAGHGQGGRGDPMSDPVRYPQNPHRTVPRQIPQ